MKPNFLTKETILDYQVKDRGFPEFRVGDTIEVAQRVIEGEKERIQGFKGDVIAMKKRGIATTFVVRYIGADGIGVERIFPFHSPMINEIKIIRQGVVRRGKLFYLRDRVGKHAKIEEKITTKEQKIAKAAKKSESK